MIIIQKAQFHISMVFSKLSKNSYVRNSLGKLHTLNIACKNDRRRDETLAYVAK